jgi:hypothetical protein
MRLFSLILVLLMLLIPSGQDTTNIKYRVYGTQVRDSINSSFNRLERHLWPSDSSLRYIDYIDFNLTDGWAMQEGRAGWNDDDKTLEVGLDQGSVLQIGQEIHMRSTNKTGLDIADGSVVYVSGAQGNRPTIALASDTSITSLLTLGVTTQDIANNDIGYTTMVGLVRGIDTRGFTPGQPLWIGTEPGTLTNVRPDAPNTAVTLGVALNSVEDGLIAVRVTVVQRLAWLSDVSARGNQTSWDMLYWDTATLTWKVNDGKMRLDNLSTYADNTAATGGGLVAGDLYKTATGQVMVVY